MTDFDQFALGFGECKSPEEIEVLKDGLLVKIEKIVTKLRDREV